MEPTEHTYEDAGRLCGVSSETIRHRAKRGKLQRGRPTNTGRPTVILTADDIAAISVGRPTTGQPGGAPSVQPGGQTDTRPTEEANILKAVLAVVEQSQALRAALEGEAAALREALNRERVRADQTQAELASERSHRERTEGDLVVAKASLGRLQGRGLLARLLNRDTR